jgi:hypothetical protein
MHLKLILGWYVEHISDNMIFLVCNWTLSKVKLMQYFFKQMNFINKFVGNIMTTAIRNAANDVSKFYI